ncbi:hypothetical protein JOS77_23585 [Chromobacterium haemolyticum]|nr:hypothetical protein JOS77_23585 [Chromobacterium haemolyticum]
MVEAFDDCGAAPPLLYHQGMYAAALPRARPAAAAEPQPGWLGDNLLYLLTQALQAYQASYRPRQLATGLGGGEARLLLVLEQQARLDGCALQREAAMPPEAIELAEAELRRKGLLTRDAAGYRLSEAGREQAATLWRIAGQQQQGDPGWAGRTGSGRLQARAARADPPRLNLPAGASAAVKTAGAPGQGRRARAALCWSSRPSSNRRRPAPQQGRLHARLRLHPHRSRLRRLRADP